MGMDSGSWFPSFLHCLITCKWSKTIEMDGEGIGIRLVIDLLPCMPNIMWLFWSPEIDCRSYLIVKYQWHCSHSGVVDLLDVSGYLNVLKNDQIFRLGLVLGLSAVPTLDKIRDTSNFLYDMLTAWLLGQDDVNKRGGHTWEALVKALRYQSVAQNEIADKIQREKCHTH